MRRSQKKMMKWKYHEMLKLTGAQMSMNQRRRKKRRKTDRMKMMRWSKMARGGGG